MGASGFPKGVAAVQLNRRWRARRAFGETAAEGISPDEMDAARRDISGWPEYAPTPLLFLSGLAARLGVAAVACKDESRRFGAGGVKALGAPHGLRTLLRREGTAGRSFTAVAATDGNHGLAVAWGARREGGEALIFVGRDIGEIRLARLRAQGADVRIVEGTYDDAVAAAAEEARRPGRLLVTDTDPDGGLPVARAIMAGYAVLAAEAWEQGLKALAPTHLFLQCGVGGVAGGVAAAIWRRTSPQVPRVVTVEPVAAACAQASLRAGRMMTVKGDLRTRMAGLSCGRLSHPAWRILSRVAFAGMTVTEDFAARTQRALGDGEFGDPPLATWDTGASGLAGLVAAASDDDCRRRLGLDADSRVFAINTEGPPPG
jgi:diaminopropionate ammonia-lyase